MLTTIYTLATIIVAQTVLNFALAGLALACVLALRARDADAVPPWARPWLMRFGS